MLTTKIVTQRITELKEKAIPGTQIIGEFMWRRVSPAITKTEENCTAYDGSF